MKATPTGRHRFADQAEMKGQATLQERGFRPVPREAFAEGSGQVRPFNSGRRRTAVRFQARNYIGSGQSGNS